MDTLGNRNTMNTCPTLLVVDHDDAIRDQLKCALAPDYQLLEALDRHAALAHVRHAMPRLVLLDLGLPPDTDGASEGLVILRETLQLNPMAKVIVTGNSNRATAVAAIESGAYDFIEKPVQLDVLKIVLQRAAYLSRLEQKNGSVFERAGQNGFEGILGTSACMQEVFDMIRRVGPSEVPVLITGESGTGKELVARAIYRQSIRKSGPFVVINCGAIPETLLESELFGYEKGAFTGAHRQQQGKLEYAHQGTLFLDEIGEMPLGLQVKLLRFLQDGHLERVGGRQSIAVDTRVLAATNRNLKAAVEKGLFREDLFYRLSVVEIQTPPLRERGEDVLLLAQAFVLRSRDELKSRVKGLSNEAREAIRSHPWPGNVRELQNKITRAVIMANTPLIQPVNLEIPWESPTKPSTTLKEARAQMEKDLIHRTLIARNWNISQAAEELGMTRQNLHVLIQKYGPDRAQETGDKKI
jgi:two-component system, NtrC family, response regulator